MYGVMAVSTAVWAQYRRVTSCVVVQMEVKQLCPNLF